MAYILDHKEIWYRELISHFGSVTACARRCRIERCNLYKSFPGAGASKDGKISDKVFHTVCKAMDLSPLCFINCDAHDSFYSDSYKMSFAEYESLEFARKTMDHRNAVTGSRYSQIDCILKLSAGLTDQELSSLPEAEKWHLSALIRKAIDTTLAASLPGWH